jgi:hypothetical protein
MPSFYWRHMPTPDTMQYAHRRVYYDLLFSLPYYSVGLLLTAVGLGATPLILHRVPSLSSRPFWSAACLTLALLLLLAVASDVVTLSGPWRGPVFLLDRNSVLFALCRVFLPAAILSGVLAAGKRWIATQSSPLPRSIQTR